MRRFLAGLVGAALVVAITAIGAAAAPLVRQASMSAPSSVTGGAVAKVTVTLTRRPGTKLVFHLATTNGTASAGVDYTAVSTDVVFTPRDWSPKSGLDFDDRT